MKLKIDEINKAIPYKEYFGAMNLTDKQKKERIAFAERLEDVILDIYSLYDVLKDYSYVDDSLVIKQLTQAYLDASIASGVIVDNEFEYMASYFAMNFVEVTRRHLDLLMGKDRPEDDSDDDVPDEWYTSTDRAKFNAENEANTVLNYKDFNNAKNKFKYKTWHTEEDTRVRRTHVPLDGETLPIKEYFVVGDSLMRYPKDLEMYPEAKEVVNCRCTIEYHD